MKIEILLFVFLINFSSSSIMRQKKEILDKNFVDVSDFISPKEFEKTKEFILKKGRKMTYRNIDSDNPHYKFSNCDVYLGADISRNINNNPEVSDFNQLTIVDWDSKIKYYELIIVRKGDLKAEKAWLQKEMIEQHVYLVDIYGKGLDLMKNNLPSYLTQIKKEVTATN